MNKVVMLTFVSLLAVTAQSKAGSIVDGKSAQAYMNANSYVGTIADANGVSHVFTDCDEAARLVSAHAAEEGKHQIFRSYTWTRKGGKPQKNCVVQE